MADKRLSVKLTEASHAEIIAWLEENEIVVNALVIHLLRVAMTIGITQAPHDLAEKITDSEVIPEADLIGDILSDLNAIG